MSSHKIESQSTESMSSQALSKSAFSWFQTCLFWFIGICQEFQAFSFNSIEEWSELLSGGTLLLSISWEKSESRARSIRV